MSPNGLIITNKLALVTSFQMPQSISCCEMVIPVCGKTSDFSDLPSLQILTFILAKGRGNDKIRLLNDEGVRTISSDSTNRRDRAAAKHWDQFEKYMSKNLVDGITANSQEPDEYGNITVRYFERDDRAIIFQLSNGVKQVKFCIFKPDFGNLDLNLDSLDKLLEWPRKGNQIHHQ